MILRRLYHDRLAQASYLIACETTRRAVIVDPLRDLGPCLEAARHEDVRITHVTETHLHADFLSGAEELARAAGAELLLSSEGGDPATAERVSRTRAHALRDRDTIDLGTVRLDVRHTPGHTPEHLMFVVTDLATSTIPVGLVTGDFLFAGDVGRPDLLERSVGVQGSMRRSASQLYHSLQMLRALPAYLQVWPGHGAGSACGKSLGAVPQSTLGYELLTNWAFQAPDEASFVDEALRDQPDPPAYFARMKELNARGAPPMRATDLPDDASLLQAVRQGARVLDIRPTADFLDGHVPGSLGIPFDQSFLRWTGTLLEPDRDVVLVAPEPAGALARIAVRELALIGFDRVLGAIGPDALDDLAPGGLAAIPLASAAELVADHSDRTIVDVRDDAEWDAGHIPGAVHAPLTRLAHRLDELRGLAPLVVHCQAGLRSAIAASVLRAAGISHVSSLDGGYPAWLEAARHRAEQSP